MEARLPPLALAYSLCSVHVSFSGANTKLRTLSEEYSSKVVISGSESIAWGDDGVTVILPTPTHLRIPVGRELSDLGRAQPPLYQSLLPFCSLSSRLQDGAPPLFAL